MQFSKGINNQNLFINVIIKLNEKNFLRNLKPLILKLRKAVIQKTNNNNNNIQSIKIKPFNAK